MSLKRKLNFISFARIRFILSLNWRNSFCIFFMIEFEKFGTIVTKYAFLYKTMTQIITILLKSYPTLQSNPFARFSQQSAIPGSNRAENHHRKKRRSTNNTSTVSTNWYNTRSFLLNPVGPTKL